MHLSANAQQDGESENQSVCASRGLVCDCSVNFTLDIIIPGLEEGKGEEGGDREREEVGREERRSEESRAEESFQRKCCKGAWSSPYILGTQIPHD